jgi:transcriptional regulator of heat shock response
MGMDRRIFISALCSLALAHTPALASAPPKEKKKGGGESFVQIPTLTLFTVMYGQQRRVLTIDLGLDVPDDKLRTMVNIYLPRLRDQYITAMQNYSLRLRKNAIVDVDYVASSLQKITDQILGRPGAKLLLGSITLN